MKSIGHRTTSLDLDLIIDRIDKREQHHVLVFLSLSVYWEQSSFGDDWFQRRQVKLKREKEKDDDDIDLFVCRTCDFNSIVSMSDDDNRDCLLSLVNNQWSRTTFHFGQCQSNRSSLSLRWQKRQRKLNGFLNLTIRQTGWMTERISFLFFFLDFASVSCATDEEENQLNWHVKDLF